MKLISTFSNKNHSSNIADNFRHFLRNLFSANNNFLILWYLWNYIAFPSKNGCPVSYFHFCFFLVFQHIYLYLHITSPMRYDRVQLSLSFYYLHFSTLLLVLSAIRLLWVKFTHTQFYTHNDRSCANPDHNSITTTLHPYDCTSILVSYSNISSNSINPCTLDQLHHSSLTNTSKRNCIHTEDHELLERFNKNITST